MDDFCTESNTPATGGHLQDIIGNGRARAGPCPEPKRSAPLRSRRRTSIPAAVPTIEAYLLHRMAIFTK